MNERVPVLSEAQCREVRTKVAELERFWTRRNAGLPSFTLGAAAYLDVPDSGVPHYLSAKMRGNKIVSRHFGWLLDQVAEALGKAMGGDAFLTNRYALPGFHIYGHHPRLGELEPMLHWDLQDMRLDWEDETRPPGARCSFTLPIDIPGEGAGVKIWNLDHADLGYEEACEKAAAEEPEYHPYATGELFIHGGDRLHQIENRSLPEPGEVRLTLQGHGRRDARGWELYW